MRAEGGIDPISVFSPHQARVTRSGAQLENKGRFRSSSGRSDGGFSVPNSPAHILHEIHFLVGEIKRLFINGP